MAQLLVLVLVGFLLHAVSSLPLCTDLRAPIESKVKLSFCGYEGRTCCSSKDDGAIQKQFNSMNISDEACSPLVKLIMCSKCDPFSSDLFTAESKIRTVPLMCNSSLPASTSQSKDSIKDFCGQVWDDCKDIPIRNSPFASPLQGSAHVSDHSSSKLTELWQSKDDFCHAFESSPLNSSVCFNGQSVLTNSTQSPPTPKGMCLERVWNGSDMYVNFIPHPDGSNRVFVSNVAGKIWLANIPEQDSGETIILDETNVFLDLTDQIHMDPPFGMMGLALHPDFARNGRFFVSFTCDQNQQGNCFGRCACNLEVGCDPSRLAPDKGSQPCQHHSVIAEYAANVTSSAPMEISVNPYEVRRIFTMGLPYTSNHGGQILFGPTDRYLYFMMGDGGGRGDPYNFAQNKKSLLGKIMRIDVDNIPNSDEIDQLGLWGNYTIPDDNPFIDDRASRHEIWALGFKNPWRCSFDSERPSYFFCADVGEDTYEEVDLVTKGGNYGWNVYEGPLRFQPPSSSNQNSTPSDLIPPVMIYKHITQSASIVGGYVYRSETDPCMFGRYLYADMYATSIWTGVESPPSSGNYTSNLISFKCAGNSPIPCESVTGSFLPLLKYIYSFGEDNNKNVYLLAQNGIYRVVRPSRCNYTCPIEKAVAETPRVTLSSAQSMEIPWLVLVMLLFLIYASGLRM